MNSIRRFRVLDGRTLRTWFLRVALLAIVYHLAARVGLSMAYLQSNTSPVWPPTGIALAALLLFGVSLWPGITLGVFLGSLLTGAPLELAVGMSIGNTLEAVVAAIILQRFLDFHPSLDRIQDVTALAVVAFFSTMISATFGASILMLSGLAPSNAFGSIWITWWIGDLLGALVVTPFILAWSLADINLRGRNRIIEALLAFVLLGIITWYVFSFPASPSILHQAALYLIFPVVIWAAIWFGQRGGTTAVILVSGMAIWATVSGLGPFSIYSRNDNLILLQTFLGVVSLISLILAAAATERSRATRDLQRRADDLATLNESSRLFLNADKAAAIYQAICELAISRLGLDAAWIEHKTKVGEKAEAIASCGISDAEFQGLDLSVAHNAVPEQMHVFVLDASGPHTNSSNQPYKSLAIVPLMFSGALIGHLKLLSREAEFFSTDRRLLLHSYANLAAVVIQNSLLFEEVRNSNRQLRRLSQRLIKAQEEERLNLSRELHDESGQLLTGFLFELGELERSALDPESALKTVRELKTTAQELQDNLHHLAMNLRPASLDHLGLVTALKQLADDFGRQYDLRVEFETVGMPERRLASEVETAIYRIVQESLTNVALHAHATLVDVLIGQRDGYVVATVEDNGIGFLHTTPTVEDQLGLFGIRERVEMLKGRFAIESSPGKGTTVNVEIPIDA
ncbi:MAG: MASE1 domain-containing protein [Anaerolineales bacterium]